jgi:GntR family transcriptional regulator / MocR family aminotransferase
VELHVALCGHRDLAGQIYGQIRVAILSGSLRPGDALPPSRELSARLAVSRATVVVAYDRLYAEGFVTSRVGAGTYVNAVVTTALPPPSFESEPWNGPVARQVWSAIEELEDLSWWVPDFDFRAGIPDARRFPYQSWRRLIGREFTPAAIGTGMYGDPAGHYGLRTAIASHISVSRGVHARPDEIVVTAGIQQAMDLVSRVLLRSGDCVAVEEPGYGPARRVFEVNGARVVPVPVDVDGLVVEALPAEARLIYTTPTHQFPLGVVMSAQRRAELLTWAARNRAVVIEDDYDSEFRYTGRPIEPLRALDQRGLVLYVGTFSKVMLPVLRLGFLVAPPDLVRDLRVARQIADWHSPVPIQAALAKFIEAGLLARHVRRMRKTYQPRHERIRQILTTEFTDAVEVIPSEAGLHLTAYSKADTCDELRAHVEKAWDGGIGLFDLKVFGTDQGRPGLIFGYGGIPLEHIDQGLHRLRQLLPASA